MDKIRVFPTKHPFVKNKDGSTSNVKLGTFSFGEGEKEVHLAIPTMVDGKQLTDDEAVSVARKMGLNRYPKFKTKEQAESYIDKIHDKIDPSGFLMNSTNK